MAGTAKKETGKKKTVRGSQRGQKYPLDVKINCVEMSAAGYSVAQISQKTGIPSSTVGTWIKNPNYIDGGEIAKLRAQKQQMFVARSWNNMTQAQTLLSTQLTTMIHRSDELLQLLDEVEAYRARHAAEKPGDRDLSDEEVAHAIRVLREMTGPDIGQLAKVVGILYDKQALAAGDKTVNMGVDGKLAVTRFEDM